MQKKTKRPVQFELTEQTRDAVSAWAQRAGLSSGDFLFSSPCRPEAHLSTRQYARIVHRWIGELGLEQTAYGTHSMRRTKATLIYCRTKNLRAVQIAVGTHKAGKHRTVLGIEVDDALEMAEQTEV